MEYADFRLLERERSWNDLPLPIPDPNETRARLRARWDDLADQRERVCNEIERRRDEWIGLLQDLVRIPSVNPSPAWEKPLASAVACSSRH